MRARVAIFSVTSLSLVAAAAVGVLSCLDDPRANDTVTVVSSCDETKLSSDPSSPQSSLRAYLDATSSLLAKATAAENDMRDGCNEVAAALGLAQGTDAPSACKSVSARVSADNNKGTLPPAPGAPSWVETRFVPNCTATAGALETCVKSCTTGTCDSTKCPTANQEGTCAGTCNGTCVTSGASAACNGQCVGVVNLTTPATCSGQCAGTCDITNGWSAQCAGGCAAGFAGVCAGTCTGTCNGNPINVETTPDAGSDAGGTADGGDGGLTDGGVVDAGGGSGSMGGPPVVLPPPKNADGNCSGFCVGLCSSGADGTCAGASCLDYAGADGGTPGLAQYNGYCLNNCTGTCTSGEGTGTTTTCDGTCTATSTTCTGECVGGCTGTQTNGDCNGVLNCGQNTECENACEAQAALATTCSDPTVIEAYGVTDPTFATTMAKTGARLGRAVEQIDSLRTALSYIGNRAYGDFVAIGLQGDLVEACVTQANQNVTTASAAITVLYNANPSVEPATTTGQ